MRKKIVFGSLFAVFMLMMLPSIPAVEFNTVVESNRSQIIEQIRNMNIDEFRERIRDLDIEELKEKIKTIEIDSAFIDNLFALLYLLACIPLLLLMYFAWWINGMPEFKYNKP